ncbi:MAG TPA: PAS domain S-box protein [Roseiflexaceae bacterium]|nr:PAS domain S-box protein [Roseiflexaceae bacterium]
MPTVDQTLAEIAAHYAGEPPLFLSACDSPETLALLWQQEQLYLHSLLPPALKERLLASLGRYATSPYPLVCHSCALRGLGAGGREIQALLETLPIAGPELAERLSALAQSGPLAAWPAVETPAGTVLLSAATAMFLGLPEAARLLPDLCRLLGAERYAALGGLLAYARAAHTWADAHPELDPRADPRARRWLPELLDEAPGVAAIFQGRGGDIRSEAQSGALGQEANRRRQAEDALALSEARLGAILDHAPLLIWGKDLEGRYVLWSRQGEHDFGWPAAQICGRSDADLFPPDLAEEHRRSDREVVERNAALDFEARFSAGPEARVFHVTKFPLRDPDGCPLAVYGIGVDISARKRGEQMLHFLQQASIALVSSLDYTVTLRRVARMALPMLADYCAVALAEDGMGVSYAAVAHADEGRDGPLEELCRRYRPDPQRPSPTLAVMRSGKPWVRSNVAAADWRGLIDDPDTLELLSLAGLPRAAMAVPLLVRDQPVGALVFVRTSDGAAFSEEDLALAEDLARVIALAIDNAHLFAEVRLSEQRYRTLVAQAADGILLADQGGQVLEANGHATLLLGGSTEDLAGVALGDLLADETGAPATPAAIAAGVFPLYTRRGPGVARAVEASISTVEERGQRLGIIIVRDITERLRAEEGRLALERQLLDVRRLESLGLLASSVAHDFNNLLAAILAHTGLALEDLSHERPAYAAVRQVERTARRAGELVRQLLVYAGQEPVEMHAVALGDLIGELVDMLRPVVRRGVGLRVELGPLRPIAADAAQIRQVLLNLLINGVEAIGDGAGAVTVSAAVRPIDGEYLAACLPASDAAPGDYAVIEVRDSGTGIDGETMARIFEPFFSTKPAGRGLGLAAVLGIVRAHSGALRVESAPERGTVFTVLLPALPVASPTPAPTPISWEDQLALWPEPIAVRGLVLVADADPELRALARRALERLGFEVLVADNGPVAVRLVQSYGARVCGALIDLALPQQSGPEVLVAIARLRPDLPVVLTGAPADLPPDHSAALAKPFSPEDLRRAVEKF